MSSRVSRLKPAPRNEVFAWNPRYPIRPGLRGKLLPVRRRVNNFGDLLGPSIVAWLLRERGLETVRPRTGWQLLSVGSVLHLARSGAVVWGSGINGKIPLTELRHTDLDVRAVRGPKTAAVLRERSIEVPDVYGDPGLLVSQMWPHLRRKRDESATHGVAVVQSLNDRTTHPLVGANDVVVDPCDDMESVVRSIAASDFVVSSSLHGLVVAEAYGVPARLLAPEQESLFKYDDYYLGTGRDVSRPATTIDEAIRLGGETPPSWQAQPLLDAFPADLWTRHG